MAHRAPCSIRALSPSNLSFTPSLLPFTLRTTSSPSLSPIRRCTISSSIAPAPAPAPTQRTILVPAHHSGERLDKYLASTFSDYSRSYLQTLLTSGHVTLHGRRPSKSHRLVAGDSIHVTFVPTESDLSLQPQSIPLRVLYEDEYFVFIDKPPGMVVHPAPGNWSDTLVNALIHRYPSIRALPGPRPGIVHRIDKGTTGVLVAAKTASAHAKLAHLFAQRRVEKVYLAVTIGNPAGRDCTAVRIQQPIGRHKEDRLRMAVLSEEDGGRNAVSVVNVEASDHRRFLHLVSVRIHTGRTHQIRVHMRHRRTPILGDHLYGAVDVNKRFCTSATRPMLHAHKLAFNHPFTGEHVQVCAPLPDDMRSLLTRTLYPDFEQHHPDW